MSLTKRDVSGLMAGIAGPIRAYVDDALGPLIKTCAELARAIDELEKKAAETGTWKYRGVFKPDEKYERGDFATCAGSLWRATRDTSGDRPGDASHGWQLVAKRGADGKDVR